MGIIKNNYYYLEDWELPKRKKKITGTSYPALAGLDKFNKQGDQVLKMLKIISEDFDEFYTKRGVIAETLANRSLIKAGRQTTIYKGVWDCFQEDKNFGGIIDIELKEENTLYEIKSKNIKYFERIEKYGDKTQEEQALHYAWLRDYNECYIQWVFFTDEIEKNIREDIPITNWNGVKQITKRLIVDYAKESSQHQTALDFLNRCLEEKRIPLNTISDKYLTMLEATQNLTPENNAFNFKEVNL